jgi:hypothetical protein
LLLEGRGTIVAMSTAEPPAAAGPDRFQQPGWFTRNVFNKAVAGATRMGISLMGSRVLEVKGRKSATPSGSATCAPRAAGG